MTEPAQIVDVVEPFFLSLNAATELTARTASMILYSPGTSSTHAF
jgi:hypothetical protein